MKRESLGHILLTISSIDSNTIIQKCRKKGRKEGRREGGKKGRKEGRKKKKERKANPRETWFLPNPAECVRWKVCYECFKSKTCKYIIVRIRINNLEDWPRRSNYGCQVKSKLRLGLTGTHLPTTPSFGECPNGVSEVSLCYFSGDSYFSSLPVLFVFWLFSYTCAYPYFRPPFLSLLTSHARGNRCPQMCCHLWGYTETPFLNCVSGTRLRREKEHWLRRLIVIIVSLDSMSQLC